MKLRPYQQDCVTAVLEAFKTHQSVLVVKPTGTGKTVTFAHIADQMKAHGRTMIMAHRAELIEQAARKLYLVTGESPQIEMASEWATEHKWFSGSDIVTSVQTMCAGMNGAGRMTRFRPNDFGLFVIDEAHHAPAKSYRKVIDHFKGNENIRILGVTATPDRADEAALGKIFDHVAYVYEIQDAVSDGWLVPITQRYVEVEGLDFSKCKTTAGDLNGKDLAQVMEYESNLHRVASPLVEIAGHRKTLVFASSVAHAQRVCEIISRHGRRAAWLCGKTPKADRQQLLGAFNAGDIQYVVNVGVLTEGFDDPSIECVAIARPTKSRSLYAQMVGRGTRPLDGLVDPCEDDQSRRAAIFNSHKPVLEVIDFVGNSGRHKLIHVGDILGGRMDDAVVERAKRNAAKKNSAVDMQEELEFADREIREEKEKRAALLRAGIRAKANYSIKEIDPFDVLSITPAREYAWGGAPSTEAQQNFLVRAGVNNPSQYTKNQASQLIGKIVKRSKEGKCSYQQARYLQWHGESIDVSRTEASQKISSFEQAQRKRFVPKRFVPKR